MPDYSAYNLRICSEIPLPELAHHDGAPGAPDVRIRFGPAARPDDAHGRSLGDYIWGSKDELWFNIPDVGRYLISTGAEITIDPEPSAGEDAIRLFLLGSAFGALLLQRGYLVLHGNAIQIGNRCLICVGESGAGKSTLAAGFMRRGFDVLADDVVAIDDEQHAIPGFPRLKLWEDAAEQLTISTGGLQRVRSELNKFNIPLGGSFCPDRSPVRWIYVLNRDAIDSFRLEDLRGASGFAPLLSNSYRPEFLLGMNLQAEHMRACSQLIAKARISKVTRPETGFALDQLIDTLLQDTELKT